MKKLILIFLFLGLLLPASLVLAQQSVSDHDLNVIIKQLQEQIKNLQTQITQLQSQIESVNVKIEALTFTKTLVRGIKGDEVRQLQEFLKTMPEIYPEGLITGYFGPLTEVAVKRFQEKQGIESVGFVGPRTIAKLNEVVGTTPAVPATPAVPVTEQKTIPAIPAVPAVPAIPVQPPPFLPSTTIPPVTEQSSVNTTTTVSSNDLSIISPAPISTSTPTPTATPTPTPTPTPTSCTDKVVSNIQLTGADVGETSADISWTTDVPATTQVNYGATSSYGSSTPLDTTLVTSYSVHISGLTKGSDYHYQIVSGNCAGSLSSQDRVMHTTVLLSAITSIQATEVTGSSAKITWTTDVASNSNVKYDMFNMLGTHYDTSSSSCSGYQVLSTSHCVLLNNLYPSTLYYYQAMSAAEFSPGIFSDINQFTTQGTSAPNPPTLDPISSTSVPVHLTWSPVQTGGDYWILRKPGPNGLLQYPETIKYYNDWYIVAKWPASYNSFDDQYAEVGITYQYYMQYCNPSLGCSGPSNTQSITVGSIGAINLKSNLASIFDSLKLLLEELQKIIIK